MSAPTASIVTQSPTQSLVWMRLGIGVLKTACLYITGALMGIDWYEMTGQQQFLIVVAGIAQILTHVETFHDKTSARAEQGRAAMASGNTSQPFPPKPVEPPNLP